eukprot:gnl/TRDRNA2_/TRDRNA2_79605_c1_seq1.p1 gnl/TRDRNA2_/TRDRNA2_79605_c1~~gnl/TRDRNA2_/TRDRNA2_79605_c1_seq1.p1  ORF type:complete len:498 (-),score=79.11 gnl/TRDRNA2_/TRDRNA2_79605_c1_seq1:20-1429(-)
MHGLPEPSCANCTNCGKGDLSFRIMGCRLCDDGLLNSGMRCFESVEDMPVVKTGAALGGHFYFVIIIMVQTIGILTELMLLFRLRRRRMIVGKEIFVAATALTVEILRMALVDVFLLHDYFHNHAYKFFAAPPGMGGSVQHYLVGWAHLDLADFDLGRCTLFSRDSALLDFDESFGWGTGGHPRFKTIGWVVGGEFAMYYFFAAVVNEIADCFFVIPTTTLKYGRKYKTLSMVLELFQLGALFPAACFTHGKCLTYQDPLGVDLFAVRDMTVWWGYFIWGSVFLIGGAIIPIMVVHWIVSWFVSFTDRRVQQTPRLRPFRSCCARCSRCLEVGESTGGSLLQTYVAIACAPLAIMGTVLGILVCVGQATKSGAMEKITAVVLFSDVFVKFTLFMLVEVTDAGLRAEAERQQQRREARTRRLVQGPGYHLTMENESERPPLVFPDWWERRGRLVIPLGRWKRRIWKLLHA